jgi:hypothetical protein
VSATIITANYHGATLRAEINPKDVPRLLEQLDREAHGMLNPRAAAMNFVIDAIEANKHLKDSTVAMTVLWLACRRDQMAEQVARQGGVTLGYDITGTKPHLNWRLMIPTTLGEAQAHGHLPGLPGGPSLQ